MQPTNTHWFELCLPRNQSVYALELLAETGQVELTRDRVTPSLLDADTKKIEAILNSAKRLKKRYAEALPVTPSGHHLITSSAQTTAQDALTCLRNWLAGYLRIRRQIRDLQHQQHQLQLFEQCVAAMTLAPDTANVLTVSDPAHSPFLNKRIFACALDVKPPPDLDYSDGFIQVFPGDQRSFHVLMCLPEFREQLDRFYLGKHCESLELAPWLAKHWVNRRVLVKHKLKVLGIQLAHLKEKDHEFLQHSQLPKALEELAVLTWYMKHSITLAADKKHCRITGWTTAETPDLLQQVLEKNSIGGKLLFRPAPIDQSMPVHVNASSLNSPFRIFMNFAGTPGATDIDPTPLLAVLVPLLFGFMFPDVGHGVLLVAAGLALSRRVQGMRLLIPCGISSALFGALFGETFGAPYPIPPILITPTDEPLLILGISLLLGAGVILLGLVLSGLEAYWQNKLAHWLWLDGAVLVIYLSGLVALILPQALLVLLVALLWYLAGLLVTDPQHFWPGVGRLFHSMLELAMNTLSFARIGAFALTHSALTHVVLELGEMIETPILAVIATILGHTLIIVAEGMVVLVQTTRLILFEFFSRFLHAGGRLFRPLDSPTR